MKQDESVSHGPRVSEKSWLATVKEAAERLGWKTMHILDAIGTEEGWPDLFCARADAAGHGRCLAIETKTRTGIVSDAQKDWLYLLHAGGVEVFVWRPHHDWDVIVEVLAS